MCNDDKDVVESLLLTNVQRRQKDLVETLLLVNVTKDVVSTVSYSLARGYHTARGKEITRRNERATVVVPVPAYPELEGMRELL
jgi:hypothetical protein